LKRKGRTENRLREQFQAKRTQRTLNGRSFDISSEHFRRQGREIKGGARTGAVTACELLNPKRGERFK
jgi:hypothetical protein